MFLKFDYHIYGVSSLFVFECYKFTKRLPTEEKFRMITQIRRAPLSVHLNIAKGTSRKSKIERKSYFENARGSIIGIDAALDTAHDLQYLNKEQLNELEDSLTRSFKILTGPIR